MQLSSYARKVVATGLAASTLLWSAALVAPSIASAQVHSEGCLVLSGGIVWMITGGTRRGFTSAEVFQSYGYNFAQVNTASAEDVALPVGPIMIYADGTLVKGPSDPLVYLVAGGQKRPFTSGAVFTGLGYSFANIQQAPINTFSDLPVGANLDSTTIAHPAGTLVISNGAIWQMAANGRMGFSSAANFLGYGYMFSHVVAANSYDLASPNLGDVPNRPACTGGTINNPPPGSVSVSVASDNPAANSIVLGQSTADLAHFLFSGSGTVTQLTLQRLGVSNNALLSNVYLFNGSQRITDGAAVNTTGQITFSNSTGLFNAPADISVRSDVETSGAGGTAGQTVGVGFVSGMSGGATISGSAQGNLFTSASATLATANFTNSVTPSGTPSINAGTLNSTVWSAPLSISTNNVWLKGAMFKMIGSANTDALSNYILYVDGNQVATASGLTAINGSNYAVFTPATPFSVLTGSHTLEVRADIIKGSGRTFQFILQNAADIMLTDSQFNLNTTPTVASATFTALQAGTSTISNGFVTVQTDPSFSATSTVSGGSTNVPLGKFIMTGYGEDVQVNTLYITFGGTSGLTNGLNNLVLYVNGAQVGSAQQLTGTVSAATPSFNLGSSLIIPAGQTVNLSVQADTIDHSNAPISSGTIQVTVHFTGSTMNNAQGRVSQNLINVPSADVTSPALTIGSGGFTVASNAAYTNQVLSPNATNQKIGSFVLQAGNNEPILVSNLAVALVRNTDHTTALSTTDGGSSNWPAYTDISNVKVAVNSGTPSSPQPSAASFNFSQSFTIPQNGTATVDVWGDLGGTAAGQLFNVTLLPTARGTVSNSSVTPGSATAGQAITLNAGSLTNPPVFTTASSSASQYIAAAGGAAAGSLNSFNLAATNGAVTVSELKFGVLGSVAGTVSSITVGSVSAPVITPTATAVAASGSTLANTTNPVTFNVLTSANMQIGSILTDGSEDMLVTAIPSSTSVTVARGQDGTAAASHADNSTVTINGLAYLTGLNLAVPNGSGGIYINASPTYTNIGTNGLVSGSTSRIALTYYKFSSGSSTTSNATSATVPANTMDLVGSVPNLSVTSTSNSGLQIGENHALDVTITPSSKGNVQINTMVFNASVSTVTLANSATPNAVVRLAVGSNTITGSSCTVTSLVITCTLPSGYVLTGGTPQTLTLFVTVGGSLGAAGTSSLTAALGSSALFSWTDTAGTGVTFTGTNSTYFNNYPTQTWSEHN